MNRFLVFLKQVPKSTRVKLDPQTNTLIRSSAATMTNPDDLHALAQAINVRRELGGEVIAITMGPPQAKTVLNEALLYGADRAILVSDRQFAGSDTLATSRVLSAVAQKLSPYTLLFFGKMAIDGDTAQVGPEVAALQQIPQATQIKNIHKWTNHCVQYYKECGDKLKLNQIIFPASIIVSKNLGSLPHTTIRQWRTSQHKEIESWALSDLKLDPHLLGLNGSPTQVVDTFLPHTKKNIKWLQTSKQLLEIIS